MKNKNLDLSNFNVPQHTKEVKEGGKLYYNKFERTDIISKSQIKGKVIFYFLNFFY